LNQILKRFNHHIPVSVYVCLLYLCPVRQVSKISSIAIREGITRIRNLLHVFLHTFQNGHGVRLNTGITGGSFQHNKNMDSHVVLANSGVGPRMCVEDCCYFSLKQNVYSE
jgi:hypothetical protein